MTNDDAFPARPIFTVQSIREDAKGFMRFFSQEPQLRDADFAFLKLTGHPLVSLSNEQTIYIGNLFNRLVGTFYADYKVFRYLPIATEQV